MAQLTKDLPEVKASKVNDQGKAVKGTDGKVMKKTFSGRQWQLMGSDPKTNGGWKAAESTPSEIVETGNLTGATLKDGQGSGVDGENKIASQPDTEDDNEEVIDVTSKIV